MTPMRGGVGSRNAGATSRASTIRWHEPRMRPCPPGWPTPRHRQGSTETRRGQPVAFHQRDAGCRFHDALCIGCSHAPPNSTRAQKISSRIAAVVEITFHCRSASRRPELAIIALTAESWSDRVSKALRAATSFMHDAAEISRRAARRESGESEPSRV